MIAKVVEVAATPDVDAAWVTSLINQLVALAMGGRPSLARCQGTLRGDRPRLAEVVAGVVEWMGRKFCLGSTAAELASGDGRRFVVGGPLLGSSSRTDPEAFFTGVKGDHEFGWVPSNGGVGEPAWIRGRHGRLLGCGGGFAAAKVRGCLLAGRRLRKTGLNMASRSTRGGLAAEQVFHSVVQGRGLRFDVARFRRRMPIRPGRRRQRTWVTSGLRRQAHDGVGWSLGVAGWRQARPRRACRRRWWAEARRHVRGQRPR